RSDGASKSLRDLLLESVPDAGDLPGRADIAPESAEAAGKLWKAMKELGGSAYAADGQLRTSMMTALMPEAGNTNATKTRVSVLDGSVLRDEMIQAAIQNGGDAALVLH